MMTAEIEDIVLKANTGDAPALEELVRHCQNKLYPLARRMVVDPESATDATQEILILIITKLATFRGESKFDTWAYKVAFNYLLTARKMLERERNITFSDFGDDLIAGLADDTNAAPDDHIMLNELRVTCTMAMLLCLDPNHRACYILGEILEFEHRLSADILQIEPANFRKRLSRARQDVTNFAKNACGLANENAACHCKKRLPIAVELGRIGSQPSGDLLEAPNFKAVKELATNTNKALVAAKLQQATGPLVPQKDFAKNILRLVEQQV